MRHIDCPLRRRRNTPHATIDHARGVRREPSRAGKKVASRARRGSCTVGKGDRAEFPFRQDSPIRGKHAPDGAGASGSEAGGREEGEAGREQPVAARAERRGRVHAPRRPPFTCASASKLRARPERASLENAQSDAWPRGEPEFPASTAFVGFQERPSAIEDRSRFSQRQPALEPLIDEAGRAASRLGASNEHDRHSGHGHRLRSCTRRNS